MALSTGPGRRLRISGPCALPTPVLAGLVWLGSFDFSTYLGKILFYSLQNMPNDLETRFFFFFLRSLVSCKSFVFNTYKNGFF